MNNYNRLVMEKDHMEKVYHDPNVLIRFAQTKRINKILDLLPNKKKLKILDCGCGEGHLISLIQDRYPQAELFGVDITEVALNKAKERLPGVKFYKNDISQLKFKDNSFDVVISTEVLEHVYNYHQALTELIRVVKPNGFLIISFPNETLFSAMRFILGRWPAKLPEHINSFTPSQISKIVKSKVIKQIGSPFPLPFFLSPHCIMVIKK